MRQQTFCATIVFLQSIIYYTVRSPKLEHWLADENIRDSLRPCLSKDYVDLDPTFGSSVDEDFDNRQSGISKNSFCNIYLDWIQYCASRRDKVTAVIIFDSDIDRSESLYC